MIDWNKYFDHIFILSRCSNFERRENLNQELKRIGLYDYATYLYQPDSELLNYQNSILEKSTYRCKYAHYSCIKMSYELGYDNICILEDDMIFLKDISEIENQLNIFLEKKSNSDIYLFDYIINNKETTYFTVYYCTDFYYINRHGMEFLINMNETYLDLPCDSFFLPSFNDQKITEYLICPYFSNESDGILIDFSNNDILPVNINISPIRICIQKNSCYANFYNQIDISLYNYTINWDKYFDHIVIVSASKYKERRERLDKEFDRIGLSNYEYFCNIMDNLLSERIYDDNINRKCCIHAHYFVIKRAYELGWDSIWIMEDDIKFLKDKLKIQNILNEFEAKKNISNVYMFDYIFFQYDEGSKDADYFGAASYWLDRKGMEYFIYVIEHWPIINDSWFCFGVTKNFSLNCHYMYYVDTDEDEQKYYNIEINIPENTVLPCYMDKSSERLCIQYEDNHVSKYYMPKCEENYIDESLYNFE